MSELKIFRASAGAGKTYRLVKEYLFLLFQNNNAKNFQRTLAVTFTNKAAGELKVRVLRELNALSKPNDSQLKNDLMNEFRLQKSEIEQRSSMILMSILHDYSYFNIQTIDTFFQRVLRNFARELGLNAIARTETNSDSIVEASIDQMLQNIDSTENQKSNLKILLEELIKNKLNDNKSRNIKADLVDLGKDLLKESFMVEVDGKYKDLWNRDKIKLAFEEMQKVIDTKNSELKTLGEKAWKIICDNGLSIDDFAQKKNGVGDLFYKLSIGDFSKNTNTKCLQTARSSDESWFPKSCKNPPLGIIATLQPLLNEAIDKAELQKGFSNTFHQVEKNRNTLNLISSINHEISNYCNDNNIFLLALNSWLVNKIIGDSDAPFIYEKIGSAIDNFMIDEFQDTSNLQWRNFRPLLENCIATNGKAMIVGDIKQSIYRFRNGDWTLLAKRVGEDFAGRCHNESLSQNWRSFRNIISFNNTIFVRAQKVIGDTLATQFDNKNQAESFDAAYNDICQQTTPKTKDGGFVKIDFIDCNSKNGEKYEELVLERLPLLVEQLQDKGFEAGDITFLCSRNEECSLIAQKFMEYKNSQSTKPDKQKYCYDVVSEDSVRLISSEAVNVIIAYLQLLVDKKNKIAQYIINHWRTKIGMPEAPVDELIGENRFVKMSIYELTESVIQEYQLAKFDSEIPFIQAFQNIVNNFAARTYSSPVIFLNWWNEKGINQKIVLPESQSAMRLMTIHRSKGLEFPVVIMPFANTEFSRSGNFWVSTNSLGNFDSKYKDFFNHINELKYFPISKNKNLSESIFSEVYCKEIYLDYIDKFNELYVAFTRAKQGLIIFCENATKSETSNFKFNTLLRHCITENFITDSKIDGFEHIGNLKKLYNDEKQSFAFGEMSNCETLKSNTEIDNIDVEYPTFNYLDKFQIATPNAKYFYDFDDSRTERARYGNIMHHLLENVQTTDDFDFAIQKSFVAGDISEAEKKILTIKFQKFMENPQIHSWFKKGQNIYTEQSIALPQTSEFSRFEEHTKRPDRFIIDGNNVTIIDYKFSLQENTRNIKQMQEYINLFKEMGYTCKAHLWYVELDKVIDVS